MDSMELICLHSGGRTIASNDKSAYIEFKFKGTGFKIFGSSNNEKK